MKMPLYEYRCRACDLEEDRLAGLDNREVICTECGEIMDRQISDDEALAYYFTDNQKKKTEVRA
jgi:putative FmdB family regulatory protein